MEKKTLFVIPFSEATSAEGAMSSIRAAAEEIQITCFHYAAW